MIRNESRLRQIDLRWEREAYYDLSFLEALGIYARLWRQALRLNPDPIADWREDLASDLAIARAVNGLPPTILTLPISRDSRVTLPASCASGRFRSCSSVARRSCSTAGRA